MGLKDDLEREAAAIFRAAWETRDGTVVPADDSLKLGNDAVKLDATVLYADLADSTKLVDGRSASFAAEIYKTFLHCAAKIIRSESGIITAYDGDRIMAVYRSITPYPSLSTRRRASSIRRKRTLSSTWLASTVVNCLWLGPACEAQMIWYGLVGQPTMPPNLRHFLMRTEHT
jgi:class 3 adenylate cyclase